MTAKGLNSGPLATSRYFYDFSLTVPYSDWQGNKFSKMHFKTRVPKSLKLEAGREGLGPAAF